MAVQSQGSVALGLAILVLQGLPAASLRTLTQNNSTAAAARSQSFLTRIDNSTNFMGEVNQIMQSRTQRSRNLASAIGRGNITALVQTVMAFPEDDPGDVGLGQKIRSSYLVVEVVDIVLLIPFIAIFALLAQMYRLCRDPLYVGHSGDVKDFEALKEWTHGPLDCLEVQKGLCCWALWCPCIPWAETLERTGLLRFWIGVVIAVVAWCFFGSGLAAWAIASILMACFRQEMRTIYGMSKQGPVGFLEDCCLYCWCTCCTVLQESRHVSEAMRLGHPATMRMRQLTGEPVELGREET